MPKYKKCKNCFLELPRDALYCPACGGANLEILDLGPGPMPKLVFGKVHWFCPWIPLPRPTQKTSP